MPKKLQSFFIYKFNSDRLKKSNYKIKTNFREAQINNELVRLGDNQLLSTTRKVTGKIFYPEKLHELEKITRKLSKSKDNRESFFAIKKQIEEILFQPEIIEVKFTNKSHYKKMVEKGFFVNGVEYVRILAGAGNLRRNCVLFIDKRFYSSVVGILDNGRNKQIKLNPAKFTAYFGLYGSSGLDVSFPDFMVISDFEYKRLADVSWINENNTVEEKTIEVTMNVFDGQGLISPRLAKKWALELGLEHTPSTFIFRAPFMKGQLVTFDFHEYGRNKGKRYVKDIYGFEIDINNTDIILSQSQFKLWQSYENTFQFRANCLENDLGFRVSRYSSSGKDIKTATTTNYMFVQVLDLSDEDIVDLCKPTIDYLKNVRGIREDMLVYMYPASSKISYNGVDNTLKSLMFSEEFSREPTIINKFENSLTKKIKESYMGSLFVEGNYQPLISDPYAQCQFLFGDNVSGLLKENQQYSRFWNERGVNRVASARSPLTHQSEMCLSNLVRSDEMDFWYGYLDNGVVLSVFGVDTMLYAD